MVGLLSHHDAESIGAALGAVRDGIARQPGGMPSRILVADTGSADGAAARTRALLADAADLIEVAPRAPVPLLERPYHGVPAKARAVQALLARARQLDARACVVIDAAVARVSPRSVGMLADPVLAHGVDVVSPYYDRHRYEGALTKGLVRPLVRALYGVRLHQPAAQELACSRRAIEWLLDDDIWDREGAQAGIDVWLATSVASGDFRLAEAPLGVRRLPVRGEEAPDLPTTLSQVVGALFADIEARVDVWQRRRGSSAVPLLGQPAAATPAPDVAVDPGQLIESYRLGYRELRDLWNWVLPPRTIVELGRLVSLPSAQFRLDDTVWAHVVYDFALGHRLRVMPRDHLLRSLVPLYLGWLASFVLQVQALDAAGVEERLDRLGAAFEAEKPYLIARWRWPERLRT